MLFFLFFTFYVEPLLARVRIPFSNSRFVFLDFEIFHIFIFPKIGVLGLDHILSILYSTATGILLGGPMGPINPVWGNGCNIFVAIHSSPPSKGG